MNKVTPNHYKQGPKEVWQMMIDIWGEEAFINFCELNAFKYRMRAGKKEGNTIEEELGKAEWYERKAEELKQDRGGRS